MPRAQLSERGRRLVAQTAGSSALNAATLVFNSVVALLLSRLLGRDGYGAYAFAIAWALLLSVPAMLGLSQLVVREIATYRARRDWARVRGLLRRGNQAVLAASFAVCAISAAVFFALGWPDPPLFDPTIAALALVPVLTVVAVRQSAMQGFGAVVLGRAPEAVVAPLLLIVLVLGFEAALPDGISARAAVVAQVLGALVAALLGLYLLRRTLPDDVRNAAPHTETRLWLLGASPILLASAIQAVNVQAGTILTGSLAGSEEAGIYAAAVRIALLLSFLLLASLPGLMPVIVELYERGDGRGLQRLVTRAARLVFLGSLPLVAGAVVFAGPLLELFGGEFAAGATALRILCVGQLVQVATGLAGTILVMVGAAGPSTWAVAAGTTINLLLAGALIPGFGAEGAAVATAASVAVTNLAMVWALWRRRRIYAAALGWPPAS